MVLVEGQLTLLSGVNIRLGGFHYLLSSETVPMPLAYMHAHSSFERDNDMQRTVWFT